MAGIETEWSHSRGENFRGQVGDVRRDLPPSQELRHFIAKGVTVVFKEVVGFSSVHGERFGEQMRRPAASMWRDCDCGVGRWAEPYVRTMTSPLIPSRRTAVCRSGPLSSDLQGKDEPETHGFYTVPESTLTLELGSEMKLSSF